MRNHELVQILRSNLITCRKILGQTKKSQNPRTHHDRKGKGKATFQRFVCRRGPSVYSDAFSDDGGLSTGWATINSAIEIKLTRASPTPSTSIPVNCRRGEDLNKRIKSLLKIQIPESLPFKPETPSATSKEIKVAQNRGSAVLLIQKLIHKQVHGGAEGIYSKISNVLRKGEQRERYAKRKMGEGRLWFWCYYVVRLASRINYSRQMRLPEQTWPLLGHGKTFSSHSTSA